MNTGQSVAKYQIKRTMKCDVIWENPAYGGKKSVLLDQPFQYVYIHRLFLICAETKKSVFCRCSYVTKRPGSEQTPRRRRVFQDDVTFRAGLC